MAVADKGNGKVRFGRTEFCYRDPIGLYCQRSGMNFCKMGGCSVSFRPELADTINTSDNFSRPRVASLAEILLDGRGTAISQGCRSSLLANLPAVHARSSKAIDD